MDLKKLTYWIYYILAVVFLLHPHLPQKLEMLYNYITIPEYEFWTTFSKMDLLDLILHSVFPVLLIIFGIREQKKLKK